MKHRILLADDSPHAQRMGERILREEGYEVVSVTDGATALIRWKDFEPDLVIADVSLPSKSGYDVCKGIKESPDFKFTKVILTAGLLEPFDHDQAREVGSDGVLRKPFEASSMLETVQTLIEASEFARKMFPRGAVAVAEPAQPAPEPALVPGIAEPAPGETTNVIELPLPKPVVEPAPVAAEPDSNVDPGLVRAAVALALEAVLPKIIDEITDNVLETLNENTHARQ